MRNEGLVSGRLYTGMLATVPVEHCLDTQQTLNITILSKSSAETAEVVDTLRKQWIWRTR